MKAKKLLDELNDYLNRTGDFDYGTEDIYIVKEKRYAKKFFYIEDLSIVNGELVLVLGRKIKKANKFDT
jgi:hypothetical protein